MKIEREWGKERLPTASVMIVDDIELNRMFLHNMLIELGLDVVEAENGKEALEQLERHKVDLIITDIKMPVKNGFELKLTLSRSKRFCNIPIIAATAMTNPENIEKVKLHKFSSYILKPFTFKDVEQVLFKFLPIGKVKNEEEADLGKSIDRYKFPPEIVERIKDSALVKWKKLSKVQRHDDVTVLGEELKAIGEDFNSLDLISFGESIVSASELYDVLRVNNLLKEFDEILKLNRIVKLIFSFHPFG